MHRDPKGIKITGDARVDVDLGGNGQVDIVLYSKEERRGCRVKILIRDGYLTIDPGDSTFYSDETPLTFVSASVKRQNVDREMGLAMEEIMGHPNLLLANEPEYADLLHLVR